MNKENGLSVTFIHVLEESKNSVLSKDKLVTLLKYKNCPPPYLGPQKKEFFCHIPPSVCNTPKKVQVFSQVPFHPVADMRVLKRTSFLSQEFLFIISVSLIRIVSLLPTDLSDHFLSPVMTDIGFLFTAPICLDWAVSSYPHSALDLSDHLPCNLSVSSPYSVWS
jgi:hypothetical protein